LEVRTNEGFCVSKIITSPIPNKGSLKVEITLSFTFAPNVRVLYTLKFNWDLHDNSMINYTPSKSVRVDINVVAHHSFAMLFINIHSYDSTKGNVNNNAIYQKLSNLHELLKGITESDETLQVNIKLMRFFHSLIPQVHYHCVNK
jgi:hypothetical protein